MSNVTKTRFIVVSTNMEYTIPGDWDAELIKQNYASDISNLGSMTAEESYDDNGATRVFTFKPRVGNKG